LEELRHDLPNVRDRVDSVADAMVKSVDHQGVLAVLNETSGPDATTALNSDAAR
jgi:hypothetical protein